MLVCLGAELLTQTSRQILVEIVALLFARIGELPVNPMSPATAHNLAHSPRLQLNADSVFAPGMLHVSCCLQQGCHVLLKGDGVSKVMHVTGRCDTNLVRSQLRVLRTESCAKEEWVQGIAHDVHDSVQMKLCSAGACVATVQTCKRVSQVHKAFQMWEMTTARMLPAMAVLTLPRESLMINPSPKMQVRESE